MSETPARSRKNVALKAGCGGCILVPLLLLIFLAYVYRANNRVPDIVVPTPTMPAVNAYDDFTKAGLLSKNMKHKSPYSMPGQGVRTLPNFAACAKDAVPVIAAVEQGLSKPYMNPPVRALSLGNFSRFAAFRETERTLAGAAKYDELTGKWGHAADIRLDGLEMGVMMPRGGAIIELLVGIACEAISIKDMDKLIPHLSSQELAHVAQRLDTIGAKRAPFADTLIEDGNQTISRFQAMLKDTKTHNSFTTGQNLIQPEEGKALTFSQWRQVARYTMANKTAMLRENQAYFQAIAQEARKPYTGKSSVPVPDNLLAQIGLPNPQILYSRYVVQEAVFDLLRTEVALYRYRAERGCFPDQLTQLTPTYLKAPLFDALGGGANIPFRYKPTANGKSFLLYSLGLNLRDDGGTLQKNPSDTAGDIVAGKMWQPSPPISGQGSGN